MAAPASAVEIPRSDFERYQNFANPTFNATLTFPFRGFHANVDGTVSIRTTDADNPTFQVLAGHFYPYVGIRVNSSGTTLLNTEILLAW